MGPLLLSTAAWLKVVSPTAVLANASDGGEKINSTAGATAVPVSDTFCGLLVSLSTIVKLSELDPADDGLNVTAMVQEVPPASVAGERGQVVKLIGNDGPVLIEEIVNGLDARFVSVTLCGGDACPTVMLLHDNDAGETETPGGGNFPVPVIEAVAGSFEELYATFTAPDRSPAAVGENSTVTVQVANGASELGLMGQSEVAIKSLTVVDTVEIVVGRRDLFSKVNFCFALVSPRLTLPKFSLVGASVTAPEFDPFR